MGDILAVKQEVIMGKTGRNERRKVAAQYLNGIALAVIASGVLGPLVTGNGGLGTITAAVAVSLAMHALARRVVAGVED